MGLIRLIRLIRTTTRQRRLTERERPEHEAIEVYAARRADRDPSAANQAHPAAATTQAPDGSAASGTIMSDDRPDAMLELGRMVANHLGFEATSRELRNLADTLLSNDKAALRLGRAVGLAVDRFVSEPGSHD